MRYRWLYPVLIILNLVAISFFIVQYTSTTYPLVGHDYRLFCSRLLDTLLHFKVEGLTIQWYTPSFGGGLPAYPNPLHMQFSLQQSLTFFVDPWTAILASGVIYLIIGFLVTFLLLRNILEFNPLAAILGANFFVASGFFIERLIVGHADKITFPLIVIPVYAILNNKIPGWLAGVLISITGAIFIHSGGVYIGIICLFTLLVTMPVVYFLKPDLLAWRKTLPAIAWGGVLTLLLCGSKLYAITAYMHSFPREVQDQYFVEWYTSIGGVLLQLSGVMTVLPIFSLIGKSGLSLAARLAAWTGSPYGFWEMDTAISPALILLLVYGAGLILFRKPSFSNRNLLKKGIAAICLILSILLVVQFSTARGFLFDALNDLPVFKSLRTNTRFVASFILPLAILGGKAFDQWIKGKTNAKTFAGFILLNGISLVSLWAYYLLPMSVQGRNFEITTILPTYKQIQNGETFPVTWIIPEMNDYEVFEANASNIGHHYDPLLGENSFRPLLHEGSVFDIEDGFYNMTDPTGYVFPVDNHSKLFSRIPVSDHEKLVDFVNRRQPEWKLPLVQIILNWATGLTFFLILGAIAVYLIKKEILKSRPSLLRTKGE